MDERVSRARELITAFVRIFGLIERGEVACCGVTVSQCCAMSEVNRAESLTVSELARRLGLDPSTATRAVDGLVKAGFVNREPSPTDRRVVVVSLTGNGARTAENLDWLMDHYVQRLLSRIPTDRQEQVLESLDLLLSAVKAEAEDRGLACCVTPGSQDKEKG